MTGDAQPVKLGKGDTATMGCTVTKGEVQATVSATGLETSIGKRIGNDASIQTGEVANLLQVQQPMQSTLSHPSSGHAANAKRPLAFARGRGSFASQPSDLKPSRDRCIGRGIRSVRWGVSHPLGVMQGGIRPGRNREASRPGEVGRCRHSDRA